MNLQMHFPASRVSLPDCLFKHDSVHGVDFVVVWMDLMGVIEKKHGSCWALYTDSKMT